MTAARDDRALGAACSLTDAERRKRLQDWQSLRDRSLVQPIRYGVRLIFQPDHSMFAVADLAQREAECCPFYDFKLSVNGEERTLDITAGPGRESAVLALLGR
jgi:MerR family transcriptional regulator, copper efflux regulator